MLHNGAPPSRWCVTAAFALSSSALDWVSGLTPSSHYWVVVLLLLIWTGHLLLPALLTSVCMWRTNTISSLPDLFQVLRWPVSWISFDLAFCYLKYTSSVLQGLVRGPRSVQDVWEKSQIDLMRRQMLNPERLRVMRFFHFNKYVYLWTSFPNSLFNQNNEGHMIGKWWHSGHEFMRRTSSEINSGVNRSYCDFFFFFFTAIGAMKDPWILPGRMRLLTS